MALLTFGELTKIYQAAKLKSLNHVYKISYYGSDLHGLFVTIYDDLLNHMLCLWQVVSNKRACFVPNYLIHRFMHGFTEFLCSNCVCLYVCEKCML